MSGGRVKQATLLATKSEKLVWPDALHGHSLKSRHKRALLLTCQSMLRPSRPNLCQRFEGLCLCQKL